jgi:hypothetical protein
MGDSRRRSEDKAQVEHARSLIEDLQKLLEDYAPPWYSRELSDRLANALQELKKGK